MNDQILPQDRTESTDEGNGLKVFVPQTLAQFVMGDTQPDDLLSGGFREKARGEVICLGYEGEIYVPPRVAGDKARNETPVSQDEPVSRENRIFGPRP